EDRAVPYAREARHQKVGAKLEQSLSRKQALDERGPSLRQIPNRPSRERHAVEQRQRGEQPRKVLRAGECLALEGGEEVGVQRSVEDIATEERDEDGHAAEVDDEPQDERPEQNGVHHLIVRDR